MKQERKKRIVERIGESYVTCKTINSGVVLYDTETTDRWRNIVQISGVILNRNLISVESFNYIIKEVWENKYLMSGEFATPKKIDKWEHDIKLGILIIRPFNEIMEYLKERFNQYGVEYQGAYNGSFDNEAIRKTIVTMKTFFNQKDLVNPMKDLKSIDLWLNARCITLQEKYIRYCVLNGYITENNNIKSSAEIIGKFLKENNAYIETHIANEDIQLELSIFYYCLRQNDNKIFFNKNENGFTLSKENRATLDKILTSLSHRPKKFLRTLPLASQSLLKSKTSIDF